MYKKVLIFYIIPSVITAAVFPLFYASILNRPINLAYSAANSKPNIDWINVKRIGYLDGLLRFISVCLHTDIDHKTPQIVIKTVKNTRYVITYYDSLFTPTYEVYIDCPPNFYSSSLNSEHTNKKGRWSFPISQTEMLDEIQFSDN